MPDADATRLQNLEDVLHAIRAVTMHIDEINRRLRTTSNATTRKRLIRRRNQLRRERLRLRRLRDDLLMKRGTITTPSRNTVSTLMAMANRIESRAPGVSASALGGDMSGDVLTLSRKIG